ncbi:hypothetical protein JQ604_33180 [Bradyrhizobium jicamae]|uniref:hypothetical protein n=1 Tax=Bradyrhizobium jicamae TaxID=280332 RepID=UPI001BAD119E|nr:hypothetical protein [Bradyrhizobium jicamae]MBR0757062.1 hypothetical protein [Bradyrhizobium jicamae]
MRKGLCLSFGILLASTFIGTGGALAQNVTSFVSSTGNDGNACTFAAPCRNFQRAHDQTNAGGFIQALDAVADFGAVVITKAIRISGSSTNDPGSRALISVTSGNAITINAPANANISLVNLELRGNGTSDNGVLFNSGYLLQIYGGAFYGFGGASPNGFGVKFAPQAFSRLFINGLNASGNGTASTGAAVQVNPASGGGAFVDLTNITAYNNAFGLAIDTSGSTTGVNAVIHGGILQYNRQDGIVFVAGAPIGVTVDNNALILGNAGNGVRAINSGAFARLNNVTITGNTTGVAALSGGLVNSYGNNSIDGNGTNGTPTSIPLK